MPEKQCVVCGASQQDRPAIFKNEDWCSENCRKRLVGEPVVERSLNP